MNTPYTQELASEWKLWIEDASEELQNAAEEEYDTVYLNIAHDFADSKLIYTEACIRLIAENVAHIYNTAVQEYSPATTEELAAGILVHLIFNVWKNSNTYTY